jgi:hypothetical protein
MSPSDKFELLKAALQKGTTPVGSAPQPQPDRLFVAKNLARSTEVVGHMLDAISKKRKLSQTPAALIVTVGRMGWTFVEMSVPRKIGNLLAKYWLQLLMLTEIVMIVAGTAIAGQKGVQALGIQLLAGTLVVWFLIKVLGIYLDHVSISWILATVATLVIAFFVWLGVIHFRRVVLPAVQAWVQHKCH